MSIKNKIITITIFGVLVIIAAYIMRGTFAIGAEWFLIPVVGSVVIEAVPEKVR